MRSRGQEGAVRGGCRARMGRGSGSFRLRAGRWQIRAYPDPVSALICPRGGKERFRAREDAVPGAVRGRGSGFLTLLAGRWHIRAYPDPVSALTRPRGGKARVAPGGAGTSPGSPGPPEGLSQAQPGHPCARKACRTRFSTQPSPLRTSSLLITNCLQPALYVRSFRSASASCCSGVR